MPSQGSPAPGIFADHVIAFTGDPATGGAATLLPAGRAAAASSVPVALSNEDLAASRATSTARIVSAAASTNATSVKASAGYVSRVTGFNANAAARYVKFYNKASAPTVGTDTPVWTEYLAAQAKFTIDFSGTPLYFSTGIALALTTGSADSDTGALTAADVLALNVAYN